MIEICKDSRNGFIGIVYKSIKEGFLFGALGTSNWCKTQEKAILSIKKTIPKLIKKNNLRIKELELQIEELKNNNKILESHHSIYLENKIEETFGPLKKLGTLIEK